VVPVGDTARVPLVAFLPVQPPLAVHESALVEDQLTVEILPELTLVGLAEIVIEGDWASAAGESANVKASAPASRGRALRSKETKAKLKLSPPNHNHFIATLSCEAISRATAADNISPSQMRAVAPVIGVTKRRPRQNMRRK
jgi:hypothetical protein